MFYTWAIPLLLVLALAVWLVFFRLKGRVEAAHRNEGQVIKDE